MKFISPVDGSMLSNISGQIADSSLIIDVSLQAEKGKQIKINGILATENDGLYTAKVPIKDFKNTLIATDETNTSTIVIYWLKNADKKYALSVDDNIFFLCDINKNKDVYKSIFDNPYLAVYKKAHDLYGAKVRLNLFYEIDPVYHGVFGEFNLSMMTDKFKDEWVKNSDWLHLAFHADKEFPDKPYKFASFDKVEADYVKIIKEICRFAGSEVIEPCTTFHWGESNREGIRAVKKQGIDMLMGYLDYDQEGDPLVSYYLSDQQINDANVYGFYKDHSEDMIFGKIDAVLNLYTPQKNIQILEDSLKKYPKKGFIEVMIHEQYFYDFYFNYEPDYEERILSACKWCAEHGYQGSFASDAVLK